MRKDNYHLKYFFASQKDLFLNVLEPRILTLQRQLNYLISNGYVIYDVSTEGGFTNLASKAVGKYVCVWTQDPSASYSLPIASFTVHEDVVILNAKINTMLQILAKDDILSNTFYFYGIMTSYEGKLTITGGYTTVLEAESYISGVKFSGGYEEVCGEININTANINFVNCFFDNCIINVDNSITVSLTTTPTDNIPLFKNFYIKQNNAEINVQKSYFDLTSDLMTNGIFEQTGTSKLLIDCTSNFIFNLSSIKLQTPVGNTDTFSLELKNLYTDNGSFFYTNCYQLDFSTSGTYKANYLFVEKDVEVFGGEYSLDCELIDSAEFKTQKVKITPISEIGFVKTSIVKNFYQLDWIEKEFFDDELKELGIDDVVVSEIMTADELREKIGLPSEYTAKITNLKFSNPPDFPLLTLDFNENFILICKNNDDWAIFCYYNKQIFQTIYSDFERDKSYEIVYCIQLWLPETAMNIINTYPEIANSPVEGDSMKFNNLDNEIII
jgi:hypothetical protein